MTPNGTETVLHAFQTQSTEDGLHPIDRLLYFKGMLYGTTQAGGQGETEDGTVFSMTPGGTVTILHSFGVSGNNAWPSAGLIAVNGKLYGTDVSGGTNGYGEVFSITRNGNYEVVYAFAGGDDGYQPASTLLDVNGTLYGTTAHGGGTGCGGYGCGTVFSVTPSGQEKVLYAFKGGSNDGANPLAALIQVHGKLCGTTAYGGGGLGCPAVYTDSYCGRVFSVTLSGTERMLHAFDGNSDGSVPQASLLNVKGTLYGTTVEGGSTGATGCGGYYRCGIVFSIKP